MDTRKDLFAELLEIKEEINKQFYPANRFEEFEALPNEQCQQDTKIESIRKRIVSA